MELLIKLAQEC